MQQHALSEGLLVAMEEWAAKQPAALPDALEAVERISELLDLSGLFCPYGALESYLTKDGCRVMTRDPGDNLWAQTFDWLAPEPLLAHLNADTKGDFLELTLADALPARRAAADRRCRAHFGGAAAVGQPAPAESDAGGRRVQRQLQVLPEAQSSGSGGMPRGAAYWPPSERMPAKKKNDI